MIRAWKYFTDPSPSTNETSTNETSTDEEESTSDDFYDYIEKKKPSIILIRPRGAEQICNEYTSESGYKIVTIYEAPGVFNVYPRIIELYEKTYSKIWWVIQSEKWDVTREALETGGALGFIYSGDVGLIRAMKEAKQYQ